MTLMERAAGAQRAAILLAAAQGNVAEEAARRRSLDTIERRQKRGTAWDESVARNMLAILHQMEAQDGLRKLIHGGASGITFDHLRAALVMRDHMRASRTGGSEITERVDGGNIHNGQMEGLMDRRRPLRYARNAAVDAITETAIAPAAMEIILIGRTPRSACDRTGVPWGGKVRPRLCRAICEALDAAAAHIGVAR